MFAKDRDKVSDQRRRQLLNELCLTEADLEYMGGEQRAMVEDIIDKVLKIREAA